MNFENSKTPNPILVLPFAVAGYIVVITVNGAVPGISMPTLGQAVWLAGFAQSLASADTFSVWAFDMGFPRPTPLAFGLPAALPAALAIWLGLSASTAYSLSFAIWFLVAFCGAYALLRSFGVGKLQSVFGATLWLILPIIREHNGYSALTLSLGLLPTYLYFFISFYRKRGVSNFIFLQLFSIIAIFMDGYGFIFFFSASSIFIFCDTIQNRKFNILSSASTLISFFVAYILYAMYIEQGSYERAPLDFFRGWGLDLSFILFPPTGLFAIPDFLSFSVERRESQYFGDASVYLTTFSIFLLLPAVVLWAMPYGDRRLKTALALIGFVGFYMALGPSFKFMSLRPEGMGRFMPAEYALGPTGTGWISTYLPGFYNLRASYRWLALALLGSWALCFVALSDPRLDRRYLYGLAVLCILIVFPHPHRFSSQYTGYRDAMLAMDTDFAPLKDRFTHGELVAFVPTGNDFLINYLAPYVGITAFNVGGDKNVAMARAEWPEPLRQLSRAGHNPGFAVNVGKLLDSGAADAVAISKLDLLWAAHKWPYPVQLPDGIQPHLATLVQSDLFEIDDTDYFTIIRLRRDTARSDMPGTGGTMDCHPGRCLRTMRYLEKPLSNTGIFEDLAMFTDGKAGHLQFGPYAALEAGTYRLTLFGEAQNARLGFFDVVSSKGSMVHLRQSIDSFETGQNGQLVTAIVDLKADVEDLEVRVYVTAGDVLQLTGYELIRVQP